MEPGEEREPMADQIDWAGLANEFGLITITEHGSSELGGTDQAKRALARLLGDDAIRDSVDYYVSGAPGSELARSVLWLLRPVSAMERCHEIYSASDDVVDRRYAVELLRVVADARVLEWVPQYLTDADPMIQQWGIGVVDQLLFSKLVEWEDCIALVEAADVHPNAEVRRKAGEIREHLGPA